MSVPTGSTPANSPASGLSGYLAKNTITQGLLDVALLTANIAQMKYVMSLGATGPNAHPYYYPMMILLSLSIMLQISTGLCLLLLGKTTITDENTPGTKADALNNAVTAQVFLITVLNIIICSFNIEETVQRHGKLDDWLSDSSTKQYLENCSCVDPLRTYTQSTFATYYKTHCA